MHIGRLILTSISTSQALISMPRLPPLIVALSREGLTSRSSYRESQELVRDLSSILFHYIHYNGTPTVIILSIHSHIYTGKTETVKILMSHLTYIAGKQGDEIVQKLLEANPLLESFGNAKTIRNDNSSRFGKFTQLEFNTYYSLVGSKCITYLLEKSRITLQNNNERNYHIIYEILASPKENRERLFLIEYNHPSDYNYTSNGDINTCIIEGVNDAERYIHTVKALHTLGVSEDTRILIEQVIAGILHIGQLSFAPVGGSTDAACLGKTPSGLADGSDSETASSILASCNLLGITKELFITTIVNRTIEVEGKKISVPLNIEQAIGGRDALAKEIYARLFQWLVLVINFSTSYTASSTNTTSNTTSLTPEKSTNNKDSTSTTRGTIALLDIFGFESFAINRFEQLCINYANEKLQQKFAADVFKV